MSVAAALAAAPLPRGTESATLAQLDIHTWLNTPDGRAPALGGKVVAVHFFQMLCPGCVLHGLPQTQRLWEAADRRRVRIIGIHSVFEHHAAMAEPALRAFLDEFRYVFPVGIDRAANEAIPATMRALQVRGTPSWLLFDRSGRLRLHSFGRLDDLTLGLQIGALVAEPRYESLSGQGMAAAGDDCDGGACPAPGA